MSPSLKYTFDCDIDSKERTLKHKEIITKKRFLKNLYLDWYAVFQSYMKEIPDGKVIELGSGGGFFKELEPCVLCSDILHLPSNDLTFSALEMPFAEGEVSAFFMIDTFHHIPDAELFLKEASRTLISGGLIVMIEPANSFWGRFIYRNFHHEPFEPKGTWKIPSSGPMSGANGALPWIVFNRDRALFHKKFPEFEIEKIHKHTPFAYLLSGGVSMKALLPNCMYGIVRFFDRIIAKFCGEISMFTTIVIRRK